MASLYRKPICEPERKEFNPLYIIPELQFIHFDVFALFVTDAKEANKRS